MLPDTLSTLCYAGALFSASVYVYGFIIKSKGDRRWHTAGLLFSGLALANLPPLIQAGAGNGMLFSAGIVTLLLLGGLACQSVAALRGRRGDRRRRNEVAVTGETAATSGVPSKAAAQAEVKGGARTGDALFHVSDAA